MVDPQTKLADVADLLRTEAEMLIRHAGEIIDAALSAAQVAHEITAFLEETNVNQEPQADPASHRNTRPN